MRPVTDRDAFRRAANAADGARVPVEVRHRVTDPFAAYRRARDGSPSAYLETTGGQSGWGYFATDPVGFVGAESVGDDALGTLAGTLGAESLVRGGCTVPYPCGAVGWLSYDAARELEDLPATTVDDRNLPLLQVGVYDRVAAWREPREGPVDLRVCACPVVEGDADDAYDRGRARAEELIDAIRNGDPDVGAPPADAARATFASDATRAAFRDRVRRVKGYIRDGETFQANVSQRLRGPAAVHPVEAFAALRRVNPAPYSALVEFPGVDLVSASPELLLSVAGDRVLTEPIAGTRPRGVAASVDAALEADMLADGKERAEHAMLVDLERNDLGKVCRFGSVEVSEYRRVDRYAEVMHLVSLIEGRLRDDRTTVDAVAATFPGGTITGAPKPRTMGIIDEVEATRRGPYTGSIGLFGFDGRAMLSIVIRTLVRHADEYHLRVGAGIVHDSDPDEEYEETLAKGRALVDAVDAALADRPRGMEVRR